VVALKLDKKQSEAVSSCKLYMKFPLSHTD